MQKTAYDMRISDWSSDVCSSDLVVTVSIEKSELLSSYLEKEGVPHSVLNARFHESEAHIVAQAGRTGAVTIATNMAGRGTDIKLGGSEQFRVDGELKDVPEGPAREAGIPRIPAAVAAERDAAKAAVERNSGG